MMTLLFQIVIVFLVLWSPNVTKAIETTPSYTCHWNRSDNTPHVYWINMEKSVERRLVMTKHLDEVFGVGKHTRFRALTMDEIYVPNDIAHNWMSYNVPWTTREYESVIPQRDRITSTSKFWPYRVIVSTLFGRRKTNKLKEIGCTISHLFAIYQAVHETKSTSKYALIIEDDVHFLFNIDWDALAATAPKDFGILQLFNSNKDTLTLRWEDYLAKKKKGVDFLWIEKWPRQPIGTIHTHQYISYPVNTLCQHTLSTHSDKPPYQLISSYTLLQSCGLSSICLNLTDCFVPIVAVTACLSLTISYHCLYQPIGPLVPFSSTSL